MKTPIHTIGEVLKINIYNEIASCIVISNKIDQYQLGVGEPMLFFTKNNWHTRPRYKSDLTKQSHHLVRYTLEIIFDCYILLYGDQKIFLEYGL